MTAVMHFSPLLRWRNRLDREPDGPVPVIYPEAHEIARSRLVTIRLPARAWSIFRVQIQRPIGEVRHVSIVIIAYWSK
jgi:hypothetical protein